MAWWRAVLQLATGLERKRSTDRQAEARGSLGGTAFAPALPQPVTAEERKRGQRALPLDRAAAPAERLHRYELDLRANPARRERATDGPRERALGQLCGQSCAGQRTHTGAPTTRAKSAAGSGRQISIRSPAAANRSPTLRRSCLQLISVRNDSPCLKPTSPIPGILTSCSTLE